MKSITRIIGLTVAFLTPAFASAAWSISVGFSSGNVCQGSYIECLDGQAIYLINSVLVPVLFAIAFIVFLYGVAEAYIFSKGSEEAVKKGHKLIMWGIIAFVIMISVWGLVNVVSNTLGLSDFYAPYLPQSPIY